MAEVEEVHFAGSPLDLYLQWTLHDVRFLPSGWLPKNASRTCPWDLIMFFRSCLVISLSALSAADGNLRASQNTSHQNASHAQRDGDLLGDWRWNATEMAAENMSKAGWAAPPRAHGFRFMATSTRYGTNPHTSCGLDSAALVQGTDYLAVASAQAMQDGCCWCNRNGGGGATASMGCGSCGKGRFIRQLPRGFHVWTPADAEIFQKVYKFATCLAKEESSWTSAQRSTTACGARCTRGRETHSVCTTTSTSPRCLQSSTTSTSSSRPSPATVKCSLDSGECRAAASEQTRGPGGERLGLSFL
eukprot:s2142_g3.t1